MQQLYFVKKGKLEWREVDTPVITHGQHAIVRPFAVAKCDLDDAFLFNNVDLKLKIGKALGMIDPYYEREFGNLLKGPFPFGHECVAEVTAVGDAVTKIKPGDVVSVPFQISCGSCASCSQGYTSVCDQVEKVSTYGFGKHLEFGGAMSDFIKVPYADHMLVPIPDNIDPVHLASLSDNIPDAYRHVDTLVNNPDQRLLIIGGKAKSVGIYTVLLAKALGAKEIEYVDYNKDRLEMATNCGASQVYPSFSAINKKYDIVVDASSTTKGFQKAFDLVRSYGTVSSSGIYMKKTLISLINMYTKNITLKVGMANARVDAGKVIDLLKKKPIEFEKVTSRIGQWDNAIDAILTDTTKVIITRDRINKNL